MLHAFDDYPMHQTSAPMLHVGTESPNAYDRYFFNGYRPDGSVFFALAFGVYPNRSVMDGAFSVIRDGIQHNVRGSRQCPVDRTETTVGPITVTVVEPMQRHRIVVDDRHGLSAELEWTSASPVIEEPRFVHSVGTRTVMDYTRLTQFGTWSGWIQIDDERIEIGEGVVGSRDRSWGVRGVGARIDGPVWRPQFFWFWAPTIFDDVCTHLALNHEADGRPWHQSGAVVPRLADGEPGLDPGRVQRGTTVDLDLTWQQGTRWVETLTATLGRWNADPVEVTYEPFLTFHMSGIGYGHPVWGHGRWVGLDESTRDQIVLADVDPTDPTMIHIQALSRATWGDRQGIGIVEQLVYGEHHPTGITGVFDGFRG